MRFSAFDIETIPNQTIPDECIPKFDEASVKLGNLKDPLKIREALQKAKEDFEAGLEKRMSLDPDLCQIVYVLGFDSETGFEEFRAPDSDREFTTLAVAWDWIRERYNDHVPIVSFNAWLALADGQRQGMDAELQEIFAMSCEKGFRAIIDEASWQLLGMGDYEVRSWIGRAVPKRTSPGKSPRTVTG